MSRPYIVADSENNLYLTYLFDVGSNTTTIHYQKFNGVNWSEPISITGEYMETGNSALTIDNNDRIYSFWSWGGSSGVIYYRYFEDEEWREVFCPYGNDDNYYCLIEAVPDSENNLHCTGAFHHAGQSSYDDKAYSVQQTSDGGYIVAGSTRSNDGDVSGNHEEVWWLVWDFWVVKLDRYGDIEWQKCLGGSDSDWAYNIQQTSDGGYIVAGYTGSNDGDVSGNHGEKDFWVVKLGE